MTLTKVRQDILAQAGWILSHGSGFNYDEIRPIPLAAIKVGRLPVYTDCSGAIIGIYFRAGAPDPGGYDFSGYGNTDSFLGACEHILLRDALPADILVVTKGSDSGSVHAYLITKKTANGDYEVFSHGGPLGVPPKTELLSSVTTYWHSNGYYLQALRRVPETATRMSWTVLNGRGERIGRTYHWVAWAVSHPKAARKYGQVRFMRH